MTATFTKCHDTITTKNPIAVSGKVVLIELTNVIPVAYATASLQDLPLIAEHRCRWIDGKVITTVVTPEGYEASITLQNLILGKARTSVTTVRNDNLLDARRENMLKAKPNQVELNVIEVKGSVARINTEHGSITIDADKIPVVKKYSWSLAPTNYGKLMVFGTYRSVRGTYKRIQLPALLLQLTKEQLKKVVYLNGDRTDCRLANLHFP